MRLMEVDEGRWRIDFGDGLGLEVILLFRKTVAFWWWSGRLVAEMAVGDA